MTNEQILAKITGLSEYTIKSLSKGTRVTFTDILKAMQAARNDESGWVKVEDGKEIKKGEYLVVIKYPASTLVRHIRSHDGSQWNKYDMEEIIFYKTLPSLPTPPTNG